MFDALNQRIANFFGYAPRVLTEEAMLKLQTYRWPGNLRELRNLIERLFVLTSAEVKTPVGVGDLPAEVRGAYLSVDQGQNAHSFLSMSLRQAREAFERQYLTAQVVRFGGNVSQTAHFVGMDRSALHRKLRLLGVERALNDYLPLKKIG